MNTHLKRIITLLLVPALLGDPLTAAMNSHLTPGPTANIVSLMNEQALSIEASAEAIHPMSTWKRVRFVRIAQLLTAVALQGIVLQGTAGFKPTIGEPTSEHIDFATFDADAFRRDLVLTREVRPAVDLFILRQADIAEVAANQGPEIVRSSYQQLRQELVQALLQSGARMELEGILQSLGTPLSPNADIRTDQLIYQALPRYFARRGIFLRLDFPNIVVPPDRMPTMEEFSMLGTFGLSRVISKDAATTTLWGKSYTYSVLQVPDAFQYLGKPLGTMDGGTIAQAMFGNVFIYPTSIDRWVDEWIRGTTGRPELIPYFNNTLWHPDIRIQGRVIDPWAFAHSKLLARESAQPPTRDHVRTWLLQQSRIHESWHLYDYSRGRYSKNQLPLDTWANYENVVVRKSVANELDARIAEARHVDTADKAREIIRLLNELLESKENRQYRLASYNFFDLLLTSIAAHLDHYPEIHLHVHPTMTIRAQIAAQLAELTPEHIDQILDEMHSFREAFPDDIKMPPQINVSDLYAGGVYEGTWMDRYGWKAGLSAGAILSALGIGSVFLWRARRMAAKRNAQAHVLRAELRGARLEEVIPGLLKALPNTREFEQLLKDSGVLLQKGSSVRGLIERVIKAGDKIVFVLLAVLPMFAMTSVGVGVSVGVTVVVALSWGAVMVFLGHRIFGSRIRDYLASWRSNVDRRMAFNAFIRRHDVRFRQNADTTEYVALPDGEMEVVFQELKKHLGSLAGKHFMDFGAGALPKIGLAASALHDMHVIAVEKDPELSTIAEQNVTDARREGFARNFTFIGNTDGFSIRWKDFDVICIFYTEPSGPAEAARFRERMAAKMREIRPGTLLAIVFTEWHLFDPLALARGIHRDRFEGLDPVYPFPVSLNPFAMPALYLQLYRHHVEDIPLSPRVLSAA